MSDTTLDVTGVSLKPSVHFCFTNFYYVENELTNINKLVKFLESQNAKSKFIITYICYQQEKCPETGKSHAQGYLQLAQNQKTTYKKLQKQFYFLQSAMFFMSRGSDEQNFIYCTKSDSAIPNTFVEWGKRRPMDGKGKFTKDNKLNVFSQMKLDIENGIVFKDLVSKYAFISGKLESLKNLKAYYDLYKPFKRFSLIEKYGSFLGFQQHIINLIEKEPDERKIIWVYDIAGHSGKSQLSNHLTDNYDFLLVLNGRTIDISYMWDGQHTVWDLSREQNESINYTVMENLKNGRLCSYKFESGFKRHNITHVVVLANFEPRYTAMTKDRFYVITIIGDTFKLP